jgi:hypothetical protein
MQCHDCKIVVYVTQKSIRVTSLRGREVLYLSSLTSPVWRVCVVAYRPVAGQRPRNGQVEPLLYNRQINQAPFLSNGSINRLPRKEYLGNLPWQQDKCWRRCFLLGPTRVYVTRIPAELLVEWNEVEGGWWVKEFSCQLKVGLWREDVEVGVKWPPDCELVRKLQFQA